jgi:hypothetical protein
VSGNVIDGVPDTQGQDVQSQDTGLKVTGWYSGNEAQNLHFNSDLKIDGWQVLESGNQFRWLNDQGGYEYNHKKVSWDVLYDSGTKPIASTYPESSEDVWMWGDHFDNEYLLKDLDDLGASASFKEAQVTTDSASGLAVSSTRTGDSPDWIEFFWMDKDDNGGTISGEEVLILDLGEERSFMRLGLQERIEGANFQGKDDQFVLDLYNAKGKWIGTDDNSGNFYLVSDFDQDQEGSSKTINFKVGDASCSAQYVGIRAMPTETQWKDTNQAAPEGEGGDYTYSSAFAVTHISVSTSDQITYRVIDSDGSMDVATLTLTPQYTGEIP